MAAAGPKTLKNLQHWANAEPFSKGCFLESEHDKFRLSFNKILESFLKEICAQGCFWPLPPMLGDGEPVDLLNLFLVVREKGGYDVVSKNGLWDLVGKESGLGSGVASSVKLVYVKYLVFLERWLDLEGINVDYKGHLMELRTKLKGVLLQSEKKLDLEFSEMEESEKCVKDEESTNRVLDYEDVEKFQNDGMILESNDIKEECSSLKRNKRKRESSNWGMLNWVTEIGKDPCDPVIGSLPDRSRWESYGNWSEEFWKQVLVFRQVAFLRKVDQWKKYQKMHPCMYDDQTKFAYNLRVRGNHSHLDKHSHGHGDSVPIGATFQAEVPEWRGVASESEAKWLGTRVWPLDKKERGDLVEFDRIGKGRQDSCGCPLQGSIECLKFHVAETRRRLKLELGSAFNQWRFDKMGEEAAGRMKKRRCYHRG